MKYFFYFLSAAFALVSIFEFISLCFYAYKLEFDLVAMGICFTLFTGFAASICFGIAKGKNKNVKDK